MVERQLLALIPKLEAMSGALQSVIRRVGVCEDRLEDHASLLKLLEEPVPLQQETSPEHTIILEEVGSTTPRRMDSPSGKRRARTSAQSSSTELEDSDATAWNLLAGNPDVSEPLVEEPTDVTTGFSLSSTAHFPYRTDISNMDGIWAPTRTSPRAELARQLAIDVLFPKPNGALAKAVSRHQEVKPCSAEEAAMEEKATAVTPIVGDSFRVSECVDSKSVPDYVTETSSHEEWMGKEMNRPLSEDLAGQVLQLRAEMDALRMRLVKDVPPERRRVSELSQVSRAESAESASKARLRAKIQRHGARASAVLSPPQSCFFSLDRSEDTRPSSERESSQPSDSEKSAEQCERRMSVIKTASLRKRVSRVSLPSFAGVGSILEDLRAVVEGEIMSTHPAVQEIFSSANTVHLRPSVWDVALFMAYTPLGKGTNAAVILPLMLTMFLQISFTCVVVLFIMNSEDAPWTLTEGFEIWRQSVGNETLRAVCKLDGSLTTSFRQQQTYDIYSTYTLNLFGEGHGLHSAGPFTCLLVCCAWTLTVLQVLGGVMDKVLSVYHLTDFRSQVMELQVFQTVRSSGFKIMKIPMHRGTWFFSISVMEGVIGVLLLMAGITWLVTTKEIVELLLNSVALAYIMDLDELIYSVLIPVKLATMMRLLEPLPAKWPMVVPVRSMTLTILGIPCVVTSLYFINMQLEESIILQETLCPQALVALFG